MRTVLALAAAALLCSACGGVRSNAVVASFYPLAWAAGPGTLDLTPPGAEPHDVELTPRQVAEVQRARVVLYLGGGFQPSVERAVRDTRGLALDLSSTRDPHVWLDPVRFAAIVRRAGLELHRSTGRREAILRGIDARYRTGLAHCARRTIVTTHAAFGYLARRYGLQQVAITGVDPDAETTPRTLVELVRRIRREHIPTVFFEPLAARALASTVARETGARTAVLDPIENATNGSTYPELMLANLRALREALGCR
jgi:zinc transport system substrate-binding protein